MLVRRALKGEIDFHFIGPQLPSRGTNAQPSARGGLTARQQKRIAEFIEEHVAEELPLATLARFAGLSSYHFARAFKQSFGVPPHRYHTGRRIERAKMLLQTSSRPVTEVALTVSFAETSSFSAAFRKFTGVAPSDYRRRPG